ncbi:MAG: CRISPR-associated helicase Cas3' [bacterium]
MNKFLAKSNPKETIQVHTNNLIRNYELFKTIYPNLKLNWDILYLACLYHDLGKMNRKFQLKLEKGKKLEDEIPHGVLSINFINVRELKEKGYSNDEIRILIHSIAYHHERDLDYSNTTLEEEINGLKDQICLFKYERIKNLQLKKIGAKFFRKDRIYERQNQEIFLKYVIIKGLLNRLDYAASGYIDVEQKNDFLIASLNKLMNKWRRFNVAANWNSLQKYMIKNREKNVISIAQTGMGKTEAGLLWIGNNKGFFALPLKTAINAMYDRISKDIIQEQVDNRIGLLHSDTYSQYMNNVKEDEDVDEYYTKTKQLSLPLTICTLDQIFDFVFRYRGFEPKLATLAYSKIVIDEVQMYSADLIAYLIIGLSYITKVGGKFAIVTATLPDFILDLLKKEGIPFASPKIFTNNTIRHSLKVINEQLNVDFILDWLKDNKVLVICNTVKKAQEIYKQLSNYNVDNINLLHSNFIKEDRNKKEKELLKMGSNKSNSKGIWISTQVVEASLDIDFDVLITELSDLNGLFQRMGRCYRNREYKCNGYNCFVFNGGKKECSGVGYVIDRDIHNLSKKALENVDGIISENDKMRLVNNLYNTEVLRNTEYFKLVCSNIEYVKKIEDHEMSKSEMRKRFRNINNCTIIPKDIYEENFEKINNFITIILKKWDNSLSIKERTELKYNKIKAKNELMKYTVSIPFYKVNGNVVDNIKLNKYELIPILNCNYNSELGIEFKKSYVNDLSGNFI